MTKEDWPEAIALCAAKTKTSPIVPPRYQQQPNAAIGVFEPELKTFILASRADPESWVLDYLVGNIKDGVACLEFCLKYFAEQGATKMYYAAALKRYRQMRKSPLTVKLNETHVEARSFAIKVNEKITDPWIFRHIMHGFIPMYDMMVVEYIPRAAKL